MKNIEIFLNDLLQNAARNNKVLLLKCLIKLGINVNTQHECYGHNTALHTAALNRSVEVFKLLLNNGAEATLKNFFHQTVLHSAALGGNLEIINLILENRVNINAQDDHGNTALHIIIPYGGSENEVVRLLLSKGIEVDIKNNESKTIRDLLHMYDSELLAGEESGSIYQPIDKIIPIDQD
jgi:ankyrin repeat protein